MTVETTPGTVDMKAFEELISDREANAAVTDVLDIDPSLNNPNVLLTPKRVQILARIAAAESPWVRANAVEDLNKDAWHQRALAGELLK